MWDEDGKIDIANISNESARISSLHNKYFQLYTVESMKLKKLKTHYSKLRKLKIQLYKKQLSEDELKHYGWTFPDVSILNSEIPTYVEADKDIIKMSLKIGEQECLVEYIESIVKQVSNRGFQLKTILDWERFTTGAI